MKYIRWLFWLCCYAIAPRPKSLKSFIRKIERTRAPWWKFKPYVWRNSDGKMWEVRFSPERCYTQTMMLQVEAKIDCETEEIIGFNIFDEIRKPPYKPWQPPEYIPPYGIIPLEQAQATGCCRICGGVIFEPGSDKLTYMNLGDKFREMVYPVPVVLQFGREFAHPECTALKEHEHGEA